MSKAEHPLQALDHFLPPGAFLPLSNMLSAHRVHLTISKKRRTVLGDYRHAAPGKNHRISVNGDLNPYEFLLTLLHELAHLLTFEQYGHRVLPHGKEWKTCYSHLMLAFLPLVTLPEDVRSAIETYQSQPAATANGETALLQVLRQYDVAVPLFGQPLSALQQGCFFQLENGRVFQKGPLRRKRFHCLDAKTGKAYAISGLARVKPIHP
ncbi:MAG: hypothetical protein EAZ62_07675 [Sphingobacteriia bacterium]|nr:MAG: hypothetical protein EAZ62_07675 [Sphingobacteriia bacterium]